MVLDKSLFGIILILEANKMKKLIFILMLLSFTGCAGYQVNVLGVNMNELQNIKAKDCGEVALGMAASFATHIAGHFIFAELNGVDIELVGFNEVVDYSKNPSEDSIRWMARGGFVFQLAVNTALVEFANDSYFTKGFTALTCVELLTYDVRHTDEGDFNLLDENSGNGSLEHGLYLGWSAYNFYRISVKKVDNTP